MDINLVEDLKVLEWPERKQLLRKVVDRLFKDIKTGNNAEANSIIARAIKDRQIKNYKEALHG